MIAYLACKTLYYFYNNYKKQLYNLSTVINFEQALQMDTSCKNIRIFCVVKDLKEDTKITWYHDDQPLEDDEKYQVVETFL